MKPNFHVDPNSYPVVMSSSLSVFFKFPVLHLIYIIFSQKNVSTAGTKESPFIRALVTVVCEGVMDRGSHLLVNYLLKFSLLGCNMFVGM